MKTFLSYVKANILKALGAGALAFFGIFNVGQITDVEMLEHALMASVTAFGGALIPAGKKIATDLLDGDIDPEKYKLEDNYEDFEPEPEPELEPELPLGDIGIVQELKDVIARHET